FLYHQWPDEAVMRSSVNGLIARIARLAPAEKETEIGVAEANAEPVAAEPQTLTSASKPEEAHVVEAPGVIAEPVALAAPATPQVDATLPPVAVTEAKKPENKFEKLDKLVADEELLRKEPASMPQSKSVRIALERLDRMMNAVGELVINRTRML